MTGACSEAIGWIFSGITGDWKTTIDQVEAICAQPTVRSPRAEGMVTNQHRAQMKIVFKGRSTNID